MNAPQPSDSSDKPTGRLYLVATPIGNLEDITLRALRVLQECDLIACEDTRQTQKLLSHFEIEKRMVSYHEHNEMMRAPELVIELEQGAQIALVSDAGTPLVSDPGHRLVSLCLRHHIPVVPLPGPSAIVAALAASGLPTEEFLFAGFLPSRAAERRETLKRLGAEPRTVVVYETPHRLNEALRDAQELFGERKACLAREITKIHEEFIRGTLSELVERVGTKKLRGEMTLLIAPAVNGGATATPAGSPTLSNRVEELMSASKMDRKAALKQAARERGLNKREAYRRLLLEKPGRPN